MDLAWLEQHGVVSGVAEILRERRRQVEELGWTPEHDARHSDGWLMHAAVRQVTRAGQRVAEGTGGPEDIEEGCRQAAALCAAEIDRLITMLTPESDG